MTGRLVALMSVPIEIGLFNCTPRTMMHCNRSTPIIFEATTFRIVLAAKSAVQQLPFWRQERQAATEPRLAIQVVRLIKSFRAAVFSARPRLHDHNRNVACQPEHKPRVSPRLMASIDGNRGRRRRSHRRCRRFSAAEQRRRRHGHVGSSYDELYIGTTLMTSIPS